MCTFCINVLAFRLRERKSDGKAAAGRADDMNSSVGVDVADNSGKDLIRSSE